MKLNCDEPLSNFAFNFNLRRYTEDALALSVIAVCAEGSSVKKVVATEVIEMFGEGCANGCYTCATGHPHLLNLVCGEDQIITDIIQVGRCRLAVSKPVLKAPMVSAFDTIS